MTENDNQRSHARNQGYIRAFMAFDLPEEIIAAIDELQQNLKRHRFKVSWVRANRIHLTLKFLGDIPVAEVGRISKVMAETAMGFKPLALEAKGIGVFPGIRRPRVIWVGVAGQINELVDLQSRLDTNLEVFGYSREPRPFKGHLTMGRIRGSVDSRKLAEAIRTLDGFQARSFRADQLVLYKSELKPTGAEYTVLSQVFLR